MTWSRESRRGERYLIEVPLRYRVFGEADWRKGTMMNISASGVFFQCEETVERDVSIEINFVLPTDANHKKGIEVACRGEIVRSESSTEMGSPSALAAKILKYRLRPGKAHELEAVLQAKKRDGQP
jgi:PilZ domain-containing protein